MAADYLVEEDGTTRIELEDASGDLLLEHQHTSQQITLLTTQDEENIS